MELPVDRGVSVEMVVKGEEIVAKGCPLKGLAEQFAQAFLKLDVVQVHTLFLFFLQKENLC